MTPSWKHPGRIHVHVYIHTPFIKMNIKHWPEIQEEEEKEEAGVFLGGQRFN